jgi:F-type H+/Na+-transporting ATPase subunit alpha
MSSSSSQRQRSRRAAPSDAPAPLAAQAQRVAGYRFGLRVSEQGVVASVGDGIAWVTGLPSAAMGEVVVFDDGSQGLVFQLEQSRIGVILLTESARLTAGTIGRLSGEQLAIAVGDSLLGRVVDPLGTPLDGGAPVADSARRKLYSPSPPIIARDFVSRPLYTGNKIIDTLIPIGRGQRQLLIGDNGTGKSSVALDAVIHQAGADVLCVVVLIGQKRSTVVSTIDTLRNAGALAYTTIVVAEATSAPGMRYLAPLAGCAVAEAWMWQGRDTLIVYDDLSTHARSYRELSLLLRRPPGREAYPGDIFHIHAALLERATSLLPDRGGGSMTALPIVETQLGEIAAYIPTNLISITDGQVYFDPDLFARGFLPAIDISRSVSRIGGNAQHPAIKREAGRIKLDYLQFLELEVFTRFGSRLEATMQKRIRLGRLLREVLKQDRLAPLPIEFQMAWLVAYNDGLLETLAPEQVPAALEKLLKWVRGAGLAVGEPRERWAAALRAVFEELHA